MEYRERMDTQAGQHPFLCQPSNSKCPCVDDSSPPSLLISRVEGMDVKMDKQTDWREEQQDEGL